MLTKNNNLRSALVDCAHSLQNKTNIVPTSFIMD
jgi:hypothetical protein